MDAGPVVQDLGPITPELALVDPVLAEQARKLLPDPQDALRPRARVASAAHVSVAPAELRPVPLPPLAPRPRRRWPRTVALAGLVFAAGALAGGVFRERHAPRRGVVLEVQAAGPAPTKANDSRPTTARSTPNKSIRPRSRAQAVPAHRAWAPNVLGVVAQVAGSDVRLVWDRPPDSGHVVVLRSRGAHSAVVFRGRAASFRDVAPRACTVYRYTIVNYDRQGHRSTGVPTSVVTNGCT
jgi:hypothetical protein